MRLFIWHIVVDLYVWIFIIIRSNLCIIIFLVIFFERFSLLELTYCLLNIYLAVIPAANEEWYNSSDKVEQLIEHDGEEQQSEQAWETLLDEYDVSEWHDVSREA